MYPNKEQEILLGKTFGCVRFIYNRMLSDKIRHYKQTKQKLNNTPAQYKGEFEWLKEVDSLALCNAQLNLQKAYQNFFRSPKTGFPKYKSKHQNQNSYTTNNNNNNVSICDSCIKLPKIGRIKIKQHRFIPEDYTLKSATISKTSSGKYYCSVLFEFEQPTQKLEISNVVGLDFSMKELFVSSDGETSHYPRYYRQALDQLQREYRKLSKCKKGSNNRNKQRIRVAKLHEKIANQRKDFLHKTSRKITNSYDAVCIESLDMKKMSQSLHFGKSVHDNGWGMFVGYLSYKLQEQGKQLLKVDKWFPSSKTCSHCGNKKEDLSLDERVYICDCGTILDRDKNAAINIRNEGVRLLGTA